MASIFDIFKTTPATTQTPPQQTVPGNIPAAQVQAATTDGNGTVPNNAVTNPEKAPDPNASPLDTFKDFWQNDPKALEAAADKPIFNVDPKKIAEAAAKNDFSKVASPELLAKIQGGGTEAATAMLQVMNAMAQKAFGDSSYAGTQMIEAALTKQREQFEAKLPSLIKSLTVSESLRNESPVFSHPAAAPVLDMFQKQVALKFPNASATEQREMAQNYLKSLVEAGTPKPKVPDTKPGDVDWENFFE